MLIIGTVSYAALVLALRLTGKRTLSKMNAFDLVITVALGSTLSSTMLSPTANLAEGMTALLLLVLLQYAVTWASVRSRRVQAIVKDQPCLLVHQGRFLQRAMVAERVPEAEIMAAIRSSGIGRIGESLSVVLETDGSLSVSSDGGGSATQTSLSNVVLNRQGE